MSRKRFIKLLMSTGADRNTAARFAEFLRAVRCPYFLQISLFGRVIMRNG